MVLKLILPNFIFTYPFIAAIAFPTYVTSVQNKYGVWNLVLEFRKNENNVCVPMKSL